MYLAYVKDLESNVDSASVIEELKLKYGIGVIKGEISEAEELFFAKKYFLKDRTEKWVQKEIGEFIPSKLEKNFEKIKERTTRCSSRYSSFNKYSNNSKLPSSSLTRNSGCHCKPMIRCSSIDSIASMVWSLGSIAVTRKLGAKSLIL